MTGDVSGRSGVEALSGVPRARPGRRAQRAQNYIVSQDELKNTLEQIATKILELATYSRAVIYA